MIKKYELTNETITTPNGNTLHRIRALIDIPSINVKAGDLGGYIESEKNLSHEGNAWVSDDSTYDGHNSSKYRSLGSIPNKEDTLQFKTVEVDGKKYKATIDPNNPNNLLLEEIIPRTFKFGDTVKNTKTNEYGIFSYYVREEECQILSQNRGLFYCNKWDIELVTETSIPD